MRITELLTIISAALSVILACISVWTVGNKIVKRLAIIQNRLNSLKALFLSLQLRQNDAEKFLAAKHGYHLRSYSVEIEKAFIEEYESEDTGF